MQPKKHMGLFCFTKKIPKNPCLLDNLQMADETN